MLEVFFIGLWEGSTGFALDRERLEEQIATLDAEARSADDAEVLIVPIVGLRMSMNRLQLPNGVRIMRADQVAAPVEAMRSEGMGRAAWEPQFLAVAEQGGDHGADEALNQLRELISVMRMFKVGGIGLGPFAFAPTGEDTWRRITTGAPATRPGGYRLSEEEGAALADFAALLEQRPDPDSALSWAVGRFEMGCERESAMEGLSDHLLALRAVLEGHGPVGASLPLRASALIADENFDRIEARERVEEVLELERALMNGRILDAAIELATWIEDGVRRLLRQAALGELGSDLSATADETLIATGLEAGDAQITVYAEEDEAPAEEVEAYEEPAADAPEAKRSTRRLTNSGSSPPPSPPKRPRPRRSTRSLTAWPPTSAKPRTTSATSPRTRSSRAASRHGGRPHRHPHPRADPRPRRDHGHRDPLARRGRPGDLFRALARVARRRRARPPAPRADRHPARPPPLPGPGLRLGRRAPRVRALRQARGELSALARRLPVACAGAAIVASFVYLVANGTHFGFVYDDWVLLVRRPGWSPSAHSSTRSTRT